MKVIHLTDYFLPDYGGTVVRLYNLLSRLPYEMCLLVSDRTSEGYPIYRKKESFGNITVERIHLSPQGILEKIKPFHYANVLWREPKLIAEVMLKMPFEIVHTHVMLPWGQAAYLVKQSRDRPFILEVHVVSHEYSSGVEGKIKGFYIERTTLSLLKNCDHAITLTESLKQWLCSNYGLSEDKITVVPNGVDRNHFKPREGFEKRAEKLKEEMGISGKIVMYAGHMDRINGMNELAKAIPQIIQEKPKICFILIGHGTEGKRLKVLAKEYPRSVKLLPMVPYEEMPVYYQMCDLFVIPRPSTISAETITPLKLLEVIAMEKPVLGSNVGGIAEVIKHGENGYLFEKGNMESFKKTLLEVLDADNSQIGKNARKSVVENCTWDKSAKILQKVYEDLV